MNQVALMYCSQDLLLALRINSLDIRRLSNVFVNVSLMIGVQLISSNAVKKLDQGKKEVSGLACQIRLQKLSFASARM